MPALIDTTSADLGVACGRAMLRARWARRYRMMVNPETEAADQGQTRPRGTQLVERAPTEAALTLGPQLGERLGWPAERTAAAVSAQRAAADARLDHLADAGQGLSCGALQRQRQLVMRAAEVGEVAATRQLLVAPPR